MDIIIEQETLKDDQCKAHDENIDYDTSPKNLTAIKQIKIQKCERGLGKKRLRYFWSKQ